MINDKIIKQAILNEEIHLHNNIKHTVYNLNIYSKIIRIFSHDLLHAIVNCSNPSPSSILLNDINRITLNIIFNNTLKYHLNFICKSIYKIHTYDS